MWFNSLIRSLTLYAQRLDMHQIAVGMMIICAVGFILLRGYGSRSNY
jgi:hypothetical protein